MDATKPETTTKPENNKWMQIMLAGMICLILLFIFLPEKKETVSVPEKEQSSKPEVINGQLESARDSALFNPDFYTYLNLGVAYYNSSEFQKSISITLKALQYPAPPDKMALAYNNLCCAYNALKMPDDAIKACEQSLKLVSDFQLAKNNLKSALAAKGK